MAVSCCICKEALNSGSAAKKRKRLHGYSAEQAKAILVEIINKKFQKDLDDFEETRDQNAFLCNHCGRQLNNVVDMRMKISVIEDQFAAKLQHLHVTQLQRKRPAVHETSSTRACKQIRQDEIVDQSSQSSSTKHSPIVKTNIEYNSGSKSFRIDTPWRKQVAKNVARRNYKSMSDTLISTQPVSQALANSFSRQIKREIKSFCSLDRNTLLRDDLEAVKNFDWETVWLELKGGIPTLFGLLKQLINSPESHKPLVCLILSMILKQCSPKVCLVQRAISVLLYGNGTSKIVYQCLQPLMVCLSLHGTTKLINRLSDDHDIDVLFWGDHFSEAVKSFQQMDSIVADISDIQIDDDNEDSSVATSLNPFYNECVKDTLSESTDCETDNDTLEDSIIAPPFSPICDEPLENLFNFEDDGMVFLSENESDEEVSEHTALTQTTTLPEGDTVINSDDTTPLQEESSSHACGGVGSLLCQAQQEVNETCTAAVLGDSAPITFSQVTNGYKIVIDNIDKNVRPSYQRVDRSTLSFHYVHAYAAMDRVDFSGLSDVRPTPMGVDLDKLLPLTIDVTEIENHFSVLISRMIVQEMEQYKNQQRSVTWHISCRYSAEMSKCSKVVPLGVLLYNENIVDEMAKTLDELNKYIPAIPTDNTIYLPNGTTINHKDFDLIRIPVTGDQVTVARIRGAQSARRSSENSRDRLEGALPFVEDWHTRQVLVMVLWKLFYNQESVREKATLYQLKALINRTAVPHSPDSNLNASEDFLHVVLHAHTVAAAENILKDRTEPVPCVEDLSKKIVEKFVRLWKTEDLDVVSNFDEVYVYACDFLTLGLLWLGFYDAIKEGHGDLIMTYWKILMLVFKKTGRRNYAIEALNIQLQRHYLLSEREAAQLVWSRGINTHGKGGYNMPCDLHMEHLNRRLKTILRHKGSNVQPESVVRAAKSIGGVHKICKIFEEEFVSKSDYHPYPSYKKDFDLICSVLNEVDVFTVHSKRVHSTFPMKKRLLQDFDIEKFKKWAKAHIIKLKLQIASQ